MCRCGPLIWASNARFRRIQRFCATGRHGLVLCCGLGVDAHGVSPLCMLGPFPDTLTPVRPRPPGKGG
jgi:hypothetical protein